MRDQAWLKLLDLVCHKLGADDARVEIGGKPPDDPRLVWALLEDGRRLVVVYREPRDAAPESRAEAQARLASLLESFRETLAIPSEQPPRSSTALHRELDHALATLAERTGAETVWIIDDQSPVIWGASEPHSESLDFDGMAQLSRADRLLEEAKLSWSELLAATAAEGHEKVVATNLSGVALRTVQDELFVLRELSEQGGLAAAGRRLRSARALVEIRERTAREHERELTSTELRGPHIQCFAHAIANQYQLVLVFDETYSPLHAAGNVQRAKVIRLPRRS